MPFVVLIVVMALMVVAAAVQADDRRQPGQTALEQLPAEAVVMAAVWRARL